MITSHLDKGIKTAINMFGVVSTQGRDLFEKTKQFIQHIYAKAQNLKVKIDLRIFSHLLLLFKLTKFTNNAIPCFINSSYTLVLFGREDKLSNKILIGDEYMMIDPLVVSLEIQYDGINESTKLRGV